MTERVPAPGSAASLAGG